MARGRKSALADLISQNLVGDGELLRYKVRRRPRDVRTCMLMATAQRAG